MTQENSPFFVFCPSAVLFDNELTETQLKLYLVISGLSYTKGLCDDTNGFIADMLEKTSQTVSNGISILEQRGHIIVGYADNNQRRIELTEHYTAKKYRKKAQEKKSVELRGTQEKNKPVDETGRISYKYHSYLA